VEVVQGLEEYALLKQIHPQLKLTGELISCFEMKQGRERKSGSLAKNSCAEQWQKALPLLLEDSNDEEYQQFLNYFGLHKKEEKQLFEERRLNAHRVRQLSKNHR
jgi:hypothetical protein